MSSQLSGVSRGIFGWSGWPALLFCLAVSIRVAYVCTLNPSKLAWPDEITYDQIAWKLAQTGHYEARASDSTPVLPGFLAAVYKVFGHDYRAARICQAGLGGLLVLAVFGIGARLYGRATGCLAGFGVAMYPQLIYLSGVFYAEHMFAVLLAVTVLCLVECRQRQRPTWLVSAGMMMGATVLCRPVAFVFVPVGAAYVWFGAAAPLRTRSTFVVVLATAAVIAPWTIRNAIVFHRFVPVSTAAGLHLWQGNNALSRGDADDRHLVPLDPVWQERVEELSSPAQREELTAYAHELLARMQPLDEVKQDSLLASEGWRWMRSNPAKVAGLSARRLLTLYSAFTPTRTQAEVVSRRTEIVAAAAFYPVLVLGLAGLVVSLKFYRDAWIVPGTIIALTLVYLPLTTCTRFRLPMDAFWILLAALAVVGCWSRGTRREEAPSRL